MKFYGKATQVAQQIVDAFAAGNIAQPLATIFLNKNRQLPQDNWSFTNQFLVILAGYSDARGYRQWEDAGRHVIKGQRSQASILIPLIYKLDPEDDHDSQPTTVLRGFKSCPVFDVSQTEGEPLPDQDPYRDWLNNLPLADVAHAWEIDLKTYNAHEGGASGIYITHANGRHSIALGVENANTFLHELTHAADDRLGNLDGSRKWSKETVAQLGACVLAHLIKRPDIADEGKTYHYINAYAAKAKLEPATACIQVLDRCARAVDLILTTASGQANPHPEEQA